MENGILSEITLMFRQASLVWAPQISNVMQPLLVSLMTIGWVMTLLGEVFAPGIHLFPVMFRWFIGMGFALAMMDFGPAWITDLFDGLKQLGYMLGAPPLDPSGLAAWGPVVTDPLMKSLADQGLLTYLTSPLTYSFGFSGIILNFAFVLLGFMCMSTLILSYVLTASCGFFFAFAGTSYTLPFTMLYVRLLFGTIASLFSILLISCITTELGELMQVWVRTQFLAPGVTLTMADYFAPGLIGVVLGGMFVWLPIQMGRSAYGFIPDVSNGIRAASFAGGAISGAGMAVQSVIMGDEKKSKTVSSSGAGAGGGGGGQLRSSPWGKIS